MQEPPKPKKKETLEVARTKIGQIRDSVIDQTIALIEKQKGQPVYFGDEDEPPRNLTAREIELESREVQLRALLDKAREERDQIIRMYRDLEKVLDSSLEEGEAKV